MFKLCFDIKNPFCKNEDDYVTKDYVWFEPKLTKHKAMNFQISKFSPFHLIQIDFELVFSGRDHAGPGIHIEVLGYTFILEFYDTRHWDYENDRWEKYPKDDIYE